MTHISSQDVAKVARRQELSPIVKQQPVRSGLLQLRPRDLLIMTFFWGLLYFEPIPLGPLKISQIWKGGGLLLLLIVSARRQIPAWFLIACLFAAKCLLYIHMPYGIGQNTSFMVEFFSFPALLLYYLRTAYRHHDWADRMTLLTLKVAIFFTFSALPFVFGLKGLYAEKDLSRWGSESNAVTGFFSSLSPASKIFCTATLMLIAGRSWFPRNVRYQLLYWSGVLLGTYLVYRSFTRTGWFIYAGGVVLILLLQRGTVRKMVAFSLVGLTAIPAIMYLQQDQAFILRMAGGAVGYREDVQVSLEALLQTRVPFIFTAIDNLNDNGLPAWLLGHGIATGKDMFLMKNGMEITSHNGTFTILETTGLLGLILYLVFCALLGRVLSKAYKIDPQGRALYLMAGYAWVASFLISHGLPFYAQATLVGVVVRALLVVRHDGLPARTLLGAAGGLE